MATSHFRALEVVAEFGVVVQGEGSGGLVGAQAVPFAAGVVDGDLHQAVLKRRWAGFQAGMTWSGSRS